MNPIGIAATGLEFLTQTKFLNNSIVQWLGLLGVLLGSFLAGRVLSFFLESRGRKIEQREKLYLLSLTLRSLSGPVTLLALAAGLYLASTFLNLSYLEQVERDGKQVMEIQSLEPFWLNACRTLAVLAVTWFLFRLVDIVEFFLKRWTSRTETALDDQLVPLLRKTLRVFVVIVALLFLAQNIFRWDIGALVAGLGIGGLAFALAAKDMLSNLFGSVTIFADRPFTMGELIEVGGRKGVVEEVGFRSTRLRTLEGHLVTVPNSIVANETIENLSRRPTIRRILNVTVTYDTPPEKMRRAVEILRGMLDARREHWRAETPPRVYFSDFNADSLNLIVYYWFAPPDWWAFHEFNHEFNLELLQRFNEEAIEFAFPTQTLYVKQDSPLSADVRVAPGEPPK
ncbi:MAG TPA: mechanosensitive ion channel family protein [Phycisphaerales bacterium]|nr:mechanosensitive ion channel family protein [Phycisphaerales bacterium]